VILEKPKTEPMIFKAETLELASEMYDNFKKEIRK
jgi:hypothetical protein